MAPERRPFGTPGERGAERPEDCPNGDVAALRRLAGVTVRVRLCDGAAWTGVLRTDLLTERSVSVYVEGCGGGEGVTLYIDQIAEIVPLPISAE
jgi:hypothetical protein